MVRSPKMTAFLDASTDALLMNCQGVALDAARRVIGRLATVGAAQALPERLPVCDWIGPALAQVPPARAALGQAFAGIEQSLAWKRRASAQKSEQTFWNGHANAVILGPGGLEARDDLWIGATVLAPNVRYVDHDHAPEEVYLSLTPGDWWNARMDWTDPGPTGFVYNPPGVRHAMRSGAGPFLALWYLPL
jgi:hypothetical protein